MMFTALILAAAAINLVALWVAAVFGHMAAGVVGKAANSPESKRLTLAFCSAVALILAGAAIIVAAFAGVAT